MLFVSNALLAGVFFRLSSALHNGVALTPPMGWNPWNCYANQGDGVTEDIVMDAARSMAANLAPHGYQYINLDCGWSTKHRDPATGSLLVNTTRFPHGMKWLGDQIHALGLQMHSLRLQIHSLVFNCTFRISKSTCWVFKSTPSAFKSTARVCKSSHWDFKSTSWVF